MRTPDSPTAALPGGYSGRRGQLIPCPMRISRQQKARLAAVRERTGMTIQEHVRRAIDLYLGVVEHEAMELQPSSSGQPAGYRVIRR